MTGSPLMGLSVVGLLLGCIPLLLLIGLLGRSRPTRPRCRRCRASLTDAALIPERCSSCGADLRIRGAVRFGGWRPRFRPLLAGLGLLALVSFPMFLSARQQAWVRSINGIVIEEQVSDRRLEEAISTEDAQAWNWLAAHLEAEALTPMQRILATTRLSDTVRNGSVTPELLAAARRTRRADGAAGLAATILSSLPDPELTVVTSSSTFLTMKLQWPKETLAPYGFWLSASGPALRTWGGAVDPSADTGPSRVLLVMTGVRVDGQEVRVRRPGDCVIDFLSPRLIELEVARPMPGSSPPQIEIDLELAILSGEPESVVHARFPGPPPSWRNVLAARGSTIRTQSEPGAAPQGAPATEPAEAPR